MSKKVVLVGCGNMGYAMLKGWMAAGKLEPSAVSVVEPNAELRARAEKLGVNAHSSAETLDDTALNLVIFAVKPQVIRDVVPAYRRFAESRTTLLSVAAGTGVATFEEILGKQA